MSTQTTVRPIEARHIDNSFFRLTAAQAKALTIDGELPEFGYEKRSLPIPELNERLVRVIRSNGFAGAWSAYGKPIHDRAQCWVKRTKLGWHDGKPVPHGWVWAIHIWEPL